MNLIDFLEDKIRSFGPSLALQMRPRYRMIRWSYRELGEKVYTLAALLEKKQVEPGDRVLIYSFNSPYWVAAFFAILYRGAVVVPLNPQSPPEQLERIVDKVKPKLLLKSARNPWPARPLPSLDLETALMETAPEKHSLPNSPPSLSPDSLAEIVFTSGTTGDPKGVMLTHQNFCFNVEALSRAIAIQLHGHVLNLVPLYHIYAQLVSMLVPMIYGAAVTHIPWLSSRVIREALAAAPATHLIAVPEFLKTGMARLESRMREKHVPALWNLPGVLKLPIKLRRGLFAPIRRRISKTLNTITSGGSPLDPEVENKWRALGFYVLQGYGLTETTAVLAANTYYEHRLGTVGKPLPGVEVKLSSEGEILTRGAHVMPGYYEEPALTRDSFTDGWFKTDDGGSLDPDGFIRVYGRRKYMILGPSGENVFPEDIEAELSKIEGVKDSAVVGLEVGGRMAIHAVLLGEISDGDAVVDEANRHLAPHQRVMQWSVWPQADFPRSATRKIRKEEVIEWLKTRQQEKIVPTRAISPLIRLLAQVTERDPGLIQPQTRIVPDLELDSLLRIELISRIEEEFAVELEERLITPSITVEELEKKLQERKKQPLAAMKFPRWTLGFPARTLRPALQKLLCFPFIYYYAPPQLSGLENLQELEGPVIFMPNHRSILDSGVALAAIPSRFRRRLAFSASTDTLYKKNRWFIPYAHLIFNTYPFATEADENIKPSLDHTGKLLDAGWNIMVFPEGRLNRDGTPLLSLKAGAGVLAVEMQVPIVPMALLGAEKVVPPDTHWFQRRSPVEARFGKPLRFSHTTSYPQATRAIEEALLDLLK